MIVEIHGLEIFGRHGAGEEERAQGQSFLVDVTLELPEPAADELEATLDYRVVRDIVREVSSVHAYTLLESFVIAVADAIVARCAVNAVTVRVRKPGITWAEWTAATASRERSS